MPTLAKGQLRKLVYSVGNIGLTGFLQLMSVYLLFFLIDEVHMDPWFASLVFLISYGIWNAINDPFIGNLSDRTRTRWGRRRPYIMIGLPITFFFAILIWSPPIGGEALADPYSLSLVLYMLLVIALYELGFTMVSLCRSAIFPEMWTELKDRSEVTIYRESFSVVGGILTMVLFPMIVEAFSHPLGIFGGWAWAGGVVAGIFSGTLFISFLAIQERQVFSVVDRPLPFLESFKTAITNQSWIAKTGATLMTTCVIDWVSAMAPFFVKYSLGMGMEAITIMMGVQMVTMFGFFPIWRKICHRYGTKVTLATSMVTFNIGPLLGLLADDVLGIAMMGMVGGMTIGGFLLARALMGADVIDEDEMTTGVRREGVYAGISAPISKISQVILATGTAFVLSTSGYVPGLDPSAQSLSVGSGFRLGMVVFPLCFTGIMLLFLRCYPLGKERVEEIGRKLKKLHAEKEKTMEKMSD
jgi:GPH family glycoside/pentoside/hexuronide:cation symporter